MVLSSAKYAGGARELTIAADTVISAGNARCWAITASSAGKKVKLEVPAAVGGWPYRTGFPVLFLHNPGATNAWDLCTNNGTVIINVPTGKYVKVGLSSLTGQGTWPVSLT